MRSWKLIRNKNWILTPLILGLSQAAIANVSLKNGNFFIGYTDIIYSGGFEPKVERVYNSKTPYKGIFGYGWGNAYEANLTVSADGSVVVHEYGGGAENRFVPVNFSQADLDQAVDQLAIVAQKAGAIGSPKQLADYKQKLKADATFRNDQWELYRNQGKIEAKAVAEGTQLQSNRFRYQYITRVKDGYIRTSDSGKTEKFDDSGKLVKISDKNNNSIAFEYGKDSRLKKIVDNFNRKMFFEFNNRGLVSKIEGEGGKAATYTYNDSDELIRSQDVDGNAYGYKYDTQGRHNMAEIAYSDNTTMKIAYYGLDKQESIKSIKDRDGTLTEYSYKTDPADKKSTTIAVLVKKGKQILSKSKYQYVSKIKADGDEWTYKLITDLDGEKTETTYNECCGLPLLIKQNGQETAFEYDQKGHVTKKTSPTDVTELTYDQKINKVTRVAKFSKSKKSQAWSEFSYDDKGNLVLAKNSEGKGVALTYDNSGRINTLIDQNKDQIKFKYNENSKPIEILDPKLGAISVSYTNSGEIKEVNSKAGRRIAAQVTASFQTLLDIIKPAGVQLTF